MLTENESKVLRTLLMSFEEDYSINQISRICNLSPNGAMKIVKKFESLGILSVKKIANISSYKINFENLKTKSTLELALIPEIRKLEEKIKFKINDLKELKEINSTFIITDSSKNLKIFFIAKEKNFEKYKELSKKVYKTLPVKIEDILYSEENLRETLLNKDNVIINALKEGIILWGQDKIINLIENKNSIKV